MTNEEIEADLEVYEVLIRVLIGHAGGDTLNRARDEISKLRAASGEGGPALRRWADWLQAKPSELPPASGV